MILYQYDKITVASIRCRLRAYGALLQLRKGPIELLQRVNDLLWYLEHEETTDFDKVLASVKRVELEVDDFMRTVIKV